ncbi:MAG: glycoside hydrolase family 2 TIM barrel-domain containing protein [Terriglobia bacterium]
MTEDPAVVLNSPLCRQNLPGRRLIKLYGFVFLYLCLLGSSLCAAEGHAKRSPSGLSQEILLSGGDWKLGDFPFDEGERRQAYSREFDDAGFRAVVVPGEVQLQIGLKGMDLYYQSKELTLVNEKEWWYRRKFTVPPQDSKKTVRLLFEGVDYFATVWLNGEKLGDHEGCYVPFSYDVTSKLVYGKENQLAIKVTCPWVPKGRGFLEYLKGEWTLVSPGNIMRFPFPPFILGPYWDGIPAAGNAVFPMGLFRDVKLVVSSPVVIDELFVTTKSLNADGSATLGISGLLANFGKEDSSSVLKLEILPENFSGETTSLSPQNLTVHPGENKFSAEVVIKNPQLWWSWDLGAQNLYKAVAILDSAGTTETRQSVFGIRTISRKEDMSYWLNGKRLYLKGAWYPMGDYYGSKPTRETYEKDLELYKAANLNHLVAFTVVEKPDFYDLCDRLGILEFFELPFEQFGPIEVLSHSNPRREIFVQESLRQIRQIVRQLRNHPSIIVWAAFAEARMGGKGWGVGQEDWEPYGYSQYSDDIGKLVAELAPGTIYHPSLCDVGEQHFWMGNSGMGITGSYLEHFNANTGFVSEYGGIALPVYESLKKILSPEEMWSKQNLALPQWYNLPLNIPVYAYQTSFEYNGLASVLNRVYKFVDRNIQSIQELVDDSQLYQAFIFKYATEAYRRKKYHSINGTRIWAYGEVTPGIRFNFLDYYRVPKMGYYFLKRAQERFALNFAYEEALESQVSGKLLRIPVWVINDFRREVPLDIQCEILNLDGKQIWSKGFSGTIASDGSGEVGIIEWTTPDTPGVYVLRGRAAERGGKLVAENSTFIKVTPKLFARPVRVLLIGEKKYNPPIATMLRAMGIDVAVIQEDSVHELAQLQNPEEIRKQYDVVWLASFDSLWKLLDDRMAEGLKQAIAQGVSFIHSGGPGSFHGGFGRAALLDFSPLAEVLPVSLQNRNDAIFGQAKEVYQAFADILGQPFTEIRAIEASGEVGQGWNHEGWKIYGLPGFNNVELKSGSKQFMMISGRPLLVTGKYGKGTTLVFTGFTPAYAEKKSPWDPNLKVPYALDQEFVTNPVTNSYFDLFMRIMVAVIPEKPTRDLVEILQSRQKPLFEILQDQAPATINLPDTLNATVSGNRVHATLNLRNGAKYARLLRIRAAWDEPQPGSPYLTLYQDNYFDLLPEENKSLGMEFFLPPGSGKEIHGRLIVEGSNASSREIPLTIDRQ